MEIDLDLEYLAVTFDTREFYLEHLYPFYDEILSEDGWRSDTTHEEDMLLFPREAYLEVTVHLELFIILVRFTFVRFMEPLFPTCVYAIPILVATISILEPTTSFVWDSTFNVLYRMQRSFLSTRTVEARAWALYIAEMLP